MNTETFIFRDFGLTRLPDDEGVFAVWVEVDVGDDCEDPLVAAGPHSPVAL